MATGDTAAEAGLPLVAGTEQASDLDEIINAVLDHIGEIVLNHPRKITVSPTAPLAPQLGDVWVKVN